MGYKRSKERNRRLEKLYAETKNSYGAGAYYNTKKKRYIKYQCGSKDTRKYLRKQSSRAYRRTKELLHHGAYKKTYDYWWNLL